MSCNNLSLRTTVHVLTSDASQCIQDWQGWQDAKSWPCPVHNPLTNSAIRRQAKQQHEQHYVQTVLYGVHGQHYMVC